ncbi:hypothetical protein [Carboxylicivirga sp. RSCT41]|uniref:hypothetical protein n=1 Tax=Carboxylicivirga agarovorans TaxID=3417570 RepID=UPI003D330C52
MLQRLICIMFITVSLLSCTGIDTDKISEEIEFRPNLSAPLGKLTVQYDEVTDVPLSSPVDVTIGWEEADTVFFNIQSSFAERKYIVSMLLQFDIANRYPADIEVDMYFIDFDDRDWPLTNTPILVNAADIDENGKVTKEKSTDPYPYQLPLTDEQIDAMLYSNRIVIRGVVKDLLLTQPIIDSFDEYSISAAVGIQAQIDYSINNF